MLLTYCLLTLDFSSSLSKTDVESKSLVSKDFKVKVNDNFNRTNPAENYDDYSIFYWSSFNNGEIRLKTNDEIS